MQKYRKELTPVLYGPSALKLQHYEIMPNKGCFRTHWHDRMEILRIRQGEIFVGYDTNLNKVCADQIMIIPPHTPHKGFAGDYALSYDVLMFDVRSFYNDSEVSRKYLPAIYEGRAKFQSVSSEPDLVECMDKIRDIATDTPDSLEASSYIYRLLHLLYKHCLTDFRAEHSSDAAAREFVTFIENHYAQDLTTQTLSTHFGYTTAHFCRKFKEATGLTPMTYLKIYRVEEAYKLIKKGNRNVGDIALACGFPDANYFTRCFKAHFGMPPSHFIHLSEG